MRERFTRKKIDPRGPENAAFRFKREKILERKKIFGEDLLVQNENFEKSQAGRFLYNDDRDDHNMPTELALNLRNAREVLAKAAQNNPEAITKLVYNVLTYKQYRGINVEDELQKDFDIELTPDDPIPEYDPENEDGYDMSEEVQSENSRRRQKELMGAAEQIVADKMSNDEIHHIPRTFIIEILRVYIQETKPKETAFQEMYKTGLALIERASERGIIPLTKEQINSRLHYVNIQNYDMLERLQTDPAGSMNLYTDEISIFNDHAKAEERLQTLIHELYHALSGQSIVLMDDDSGTLRRNIAKSGLCFEPNYHTHNYNPQKFPRLAWLDEAVIQQTSVRTTDLGGGIEPYDMGTYMTERRLLGWLTKQGVDQKMFTNALFEDAALDTEESSMPHTRDLFRAVDKATYAGFLADLDLVIRTLHKKHYNGPSKRNPSEGVKRVYDECHKNPNQFIAWIRSKAQQIKYPTPTQ